MPDETREETEERITQEFATWIDWIRTANYTFQWPGEVQR
jgi:nitric oxide reductase large subunit